MDLPTKSRRKELFQNKDYLRVYKQLIELLRKGKENISNDYKIETSIFDELLLLAKNKCQQPKAKTKSKSKKKKNRPYEKEIIEFKIEPYPPVNGRFAIYRKDTGELLDSAQGYGYKSIGAANKAGWYKYSKGWQYIENKKDWWRQHPEFRKALNDYLEMYWKEIMIGDEDELELAEELAKKMNVKDFYPGLMKYFY